MFLNRSFVRLFVRRVTLADVRLSPNGAFNDMGSENNFEYFKWVAAQLQTYDLAYLSVMDGLAFGYHELCPQAELFYSHTFSLDFRRRHSGRHVLLTIHRGGGERLLSRRVKARLVLNVVV